MYQQFPRFATSQKIRIFEVVFVVFMEFPDYSLSCVDKSSEQIFTQYLNIKTFDCITGITNIMYLLVYTNIVSLDDSIWVENL